MNVALQNRAHGWLGLLLLGGGILYTFPPQQYHFYPLCPFYATTHLLCPGCGGTRALYQLLHLHFAEAMHLNALVTIAAPLFLVWFGFWYYSILRYHQSPRLNLPRDVVWALFAVVLMFAILRNLPTGFVV